MSDLQGASGHMKPSLGDQKLHTKTSALSYLGLNGKHFSKKCDFSKKKNRFFIFFKKNQICLDFVLDAF